MLGAVGIWQRGLRYHADRGAAREAAAELEALGYSALWIPDLGGDVLGSADELLSATRTVAVATGILNIWMHEPPAVASGFARLEERHPGRFTLGLGVSHPSLVPGRYDRPLSRMAAYLDALETAAAPVPAKRLVLAALGPRMLELARTRTGGAHPYLVPPEHTALAREALGPDRVLAPEQAVLLDDDAIRGRERARAFVHDYLQLPAYVDNLVRLGFADDVRRGGSDRLAGALVAWGDEQAIADRIAAHHAAGADHVCIQVIDAGDGLPLDQWRRLAPALISHSSVM